MMSKTLFKVAKPVKIAVAQQRYGTRIFMPYYMGIFGSGLGLRIMMSALLRNGILVAVLVVVW